MADEFDLKPTSRGEEFLDVILRSLGGDTPDIPQPAWRYEEYLAAIANAIQNGGGGGSSGGGVLVVNVTWNDDTGTLDKTWQEIHDADFPVIIDSSDGKKTIIVSWTNEFDGSFIVYAYDLYQGDNFQFAASSESDYPVGGFVG